jgi:WD40 repeat protein/tRNA A-37 threonylcarbamoyl transferase component Bud32
MPHSLDGSTREQRLNEALAAYYEAVEAGQPIDHQEFLARHADVADGLASFFAAKEDFERHAAPLLDMASGTKIRYVGDYELLQEIARGGMGVVYRARQLSLDRIVALKMIRDSHLASRVEMRRFQGEAAAAASLDHPHIVPIYEVGMHDGQPYFSMKLIDGPSLAQRLAAGPAEPGDAARLLATVARAVHHAHQRGILHRDLKPANVLLDLDGQPHVTDFGLAKRVGHSVERLTRSHAILGTAPYLSPEQAAGRVNDLTAAADVYGLGAVLYEALTGQAPFQGTVVLDVLRQVREDEPVRPRSLNPRLDADLQTICLKCLEKEPAKRYVQAADLADDLERWLRGETIHARPVGSLARAGRWCRRNPVVAALAGGLLALLGAAAIAATAAAVSLNQLADKEHHAALAAGKARDDAEQGRIIAETEKSKAQAERDAKEKALRRADGLRLTAHATAAMNSDPGLALLLAIEGARQAPGLLANNALLAALESCHEERTLLASNALTSARFSPDGRRVLGVGRNGTIWVWDAATGKKEAELSARWQNTLLELGSAAFSPDGRFFAVTYEKNLQIQHRGISPQFATTRKYYTDRVVRLGEIATGKRTAFLKGHQAKVVSAVFSPDGKRVLTAGQDGTAHVWDAATGKELLVLKGSATGLKNAVFSPDGRRIVTLTSAWRYRNSYPEDKPDGSVIMDPADVEDPDDPAVVARLGQVCMRGGDGGGGGGIDQREDVQARVWDAASGRELCVLKNSPIATAYVQMRIPDCAAFSPDGERLVLGFTGFTHARVYETATGRVVARLRDSDFRGTLEAAFSPDGGRVATITTDGDEAPHCTVRIWDAATGQELARTAGHGQLLRSLSFSPDGRLVLAAAADDRTARVWDATTGREVALFRGHGQVVNTAAFSPDGRRVVTAADDGTARIWQLHVPRADHALRLMDGSEAANVRGPIRSITFSPDGRHVLTTNEDTSARLWDAATGQLAAVLQGMAGLADRRTVREQVLRQVRSAQLSPDGRHVLVLTDMAHSKLDLVPGEPPKELPYTPAFLFDAASGKDLVAYLGDRYQVAQAFFSPNGYHVLTIESQDIEQRTIDRMGGGGSNSSCSGSGPDCPPTVARLYAAETGKLVAVLRDGKSSIEGAAFSPDGRLVVTVGGPSGTGERCMVLWDVTGKRLRTLSTHADKIASSVAWSPDGRRLVSGSWLWDADTGQPITHLTGLTGVPADASLSRSLFSADGRRQAAPWSDNTIHVIDTETGKTLVIGTGHRMAILAAAFSRDGRRLVTASADETARVWDAATGTEIVTLTGHHRAVTGVAFSPDGGRVATASVDGTARIWTIDLLLVAEARKPRHLTAVEHRRFEIP